MEDDSTILLCSRRDARKAAKSVDLEFPKPIAGFDDFGHIALSTMPNTRDLGGMPTKDGRCIRPRRLIRSGELHKISRKDAISVLGEHDVRRVIDLRTRQEAETAPDDAIVRDLAEYHHLPVFGASVMGITRSNGLRENTRIVLDALNDVRQTVRQSYEEALFGDMGIKAYKDMLDIIVAAGGEEGATLWHCSAGKDRAGIGAILVEHILGVSEENIRRDYLATNIFSFERDKDLRYSLARLAEKVGINVKPVFYVFPEYFDYMMSIVKREFGGLDGYIREALGFSCDCIIEQMQHDYLD